MSNYSLISNEGSVLLNFQTWQGVPRRPSWITENVVRLGASQASTQIVNKESFVQTSVAQKVFLDFATMDTFITKIIDVPSQGRFSWNVLGDIDFETIKVSNLIFNSVSYDWKKLDVCYSNVAYKYLLTVTFNYIVDEVEIEET